MYCVQTRQLHHRFGSAAVLNDINLQVPSGSIYGFLGPNGAGKTTTLRLLLGLIKKQQGDILLFDQPFQQHRIASLKNIGAMIESPSLYGQLTAKENLLVLQKIYQYPKNRIDAVLKIVGLQDTGNKKASQFSLGMKQRLSIAMALLHQPPLLILDEPTNGLDPNGMLEIRDLLLQLNEQEGTSIIISSHLLAEIEKLATHVGVISKGSMVFQGTLNDLVNKQYQSSQLIIQTSDNTACAKIIREMQWQVRIEKDKVLLPIPSKADIALLNNKLVQQGIAVYELSPVKKDLETIFMELINR